MQIIKPTTNSISFSTANTVFGSPLVFLTTTAQSLITITSNTGVVTGSFVVPANQYIVLEKKHTDTVTSNVSIFASGAAYRN